MVKNKATKFRSRAREVGGGGMRHSGWFWEVHTVARPPDPGHMSPHLLMMDGAAALAKLNQPGSKASCQIFFISEKEPWRDVDLVTSPHG